MPIVVIYSYNFYYYYCVKCRNNALPITKRKSKKSNAEIVLKCELMTFVKLLVSLDMKS